MGVGRAVLLDTEGPDCGISRAEDAINDIVAVEDAFVEDDLIVGVAVGKAGGGSIVAAGAPLDVEVAVGRGAGRGGEDAVVPRRAGDLVHSKGEDVVGRRGIRQAAAVEEVIGGAEGQVAVGTGRGRSEGVTVKADRERQGDARAAVVAVVADVGDTWHNCTGAVGDRV